MFISWFICSALFIIVKLFVSRLSIPFSARYIASGHKEMEIEISWTPSDLRRDELSFVFQYVFAY